MIRAATPAHEPMSAIIPPERFPTLLPLLFVLFFWLAATLDDAELCVAVVDDVWTRVDSVVGVGDVLGAAVVCADDPPCGIDQPGKADADVAGVVEIGAWLDVGVGCDGTSELCEDSPASRKSLSEY
jgi:hypothetical protein